MGTMTGKREKIRKKMIRKRMRLSLKKRTALNEASKNNILEFLDKRDYKSILIFLSHNSEIKTREIIKELLIKEKTVLVPHVFGDEMYAEIYNTETKFNKYGIEEVSEGIEYTDKIDVVLVPLLAVDGAGHRLGYGRGFYDKFLKGKDCLKIGFCYDFQVVKDTFPQRFDVKMNYIITDKRVIKV